MKSSVIAAAAAAVVVSAQEARSPLQLGLNVGNLINVDLCLGLDVKLPLGLSIETDGCPNASPPADRTNVWHPPHHIPMDGCDDHEAQDWHYVHPCDCKAKAPHTWGTSTVTATQIKTITSCAPTVTNCPAGGKVTTVIVPATTTVCPVPVKTTLATVPAQSTPVATIPAVTQVTQAPPTIAKPVTKPVTQAPPAPGTPGASVTTPCPESATTTPSVVVPPPVWTKPGTTGTPVVVVPPPVGTGSNPPSGNYTQPPVIAGAAQNSQKIGAVVVMGLVAAFLI